MSNTTSPASIATYRYDKSAEVFQRAVKVLPGGVPGHLGPAEGCFIPRDKYPLFSQRAKGSHFWDVDGNDFIDYMAGYGPNVLGYGDDDVDAAAAAQRKLEDVVSSPSSLVVDLAELMVDTIASADWAVFAKNGGDVTTAAILTARAATGRSKIVFISGYYHGVHPWAQKLDYPGILQEDVANNIEIPWNDPDAFRRVLTEHDGEIAALIAQPYMHGNFADNELPAPGYWQTIRSLCDAHGVVLIVDDVRAGFRLDLAGSDHFYGFKADLICFCKAIANGYNISSLCGRESLRSAFASLSYTGSYWMSAVPMAAAIATINKLKAIDAPALFRAKSLKLTDALKDVASSHGYTLSVSGEPALFYLRLADDPSLMLHQRWIAECVNRGVFFASHHNHFLNASLTDADIDRTLDVADQAFAAL